MTKISDGTGREVEFDYSTSTGVLTTATDVGGHEWTYSVWFNL